MEDIECLCGQIVIFPSERIQDIKSLVAVFTNKYDRYMRDLCGVIRTRADIKTDLEEIQRGYSNRISRFVDELISAGVKVSQEQLMEIIK